MWLLLYFIFICSLFIVLKNNRQFRKRLLLKIKLLNVFLFSNFTIRLKKIAAILLSTMFLFNWFGYQILTNYLENRSDVQLELQLDKSNYIEQDLISIKIPTHLPYYNNSNTFERTDGEIEINGVAYKYVKKRFYNDSLELLCVPNVSKMKIKEANNEFAKLANDFQQLGKKKQNQHSTNSIKSINTEYFQHHFEVSLVYNNVYIEKVSIAYSPVFLTSVFYAPQEQPPDA